MSIYSNKVPIKDKLKCIDCNIQFKTSNERNSHLKNIHGLTYEQYIMSRYFNNVYPTCLCGCGTVMGFCKTPFGIWFGEYTTNHFPRKKHSEQTKRKIKESVEKKMLQLYGVTNPMHLKIMRNKIKETKKERYGDPNYNNVVQNKETKLKLYDNENYNNPTQIVKTNQIKYGANTYTSSEQGKLQVKKTFISNYGVDNPMKVNCIKEQLYKNNIAKFGYKVNFCDPEYRKKYNGKTSNIEKYVCNCINGEHKFLYDNKEFDIKVNTDIFEIDGDKKYDFKLENRLNTKLRNILLEDPHSIEVQGKKQDYFTRNTNALAFLTDEKGNMYISDINETHGQIMRNNMHTDFNVVPKISGRIWPKVKVLSFWNSPTPDRLKSVITDLNTKLKKNKTGFTININEWYIDVLAPKKINDDFNESWEEEILIPVQKYIDNDFMYPYIKPSFSNQRFKVT